MTDGPRAAFEILPRRLSVQSLETKVKEHRPTAFIEMVRRQSALAQRRPREETDGCVVAGQAAKIFIDFA